jgi:transcriptional regulator with XRE-family HTH domain
MALANDLARRLKAARVLSGKKVGEIASELDWSTQKLYRLESGSQVPDALELAAFAAATGQSVGFLLGEAPSALPHEQLTLPGPLPGVNRADEDRAA